MSSLTYLKFDNAGAISYRVTEYPISEVRNLYPGITITECTETEYNDSVPVLGSVQSAPPAPVAN
jgi:hypothetical protein